MSKNGEPGGRPGPKIAPVSPTLMRIQSTTTLIRSEAQIYSQKAILIDFPSKIAKKTVFDTFSKKSPKKI